MNTLIFCDKKMSRKAITRIYKEMGHGEDSLYVAMDSEIVSMLKDLGVSIIFLYEIENRVSWNSEKILKNSLDLISYLRNVRSSCDKSLREIFSEDGVSYWDVIEGPLFCYNLYHMIFGFEIYRELINKRIKAVVLPNLNRWIYKEIYQYATSRSIPARVLYHTKIQKVVSNFKKNQFPWFSEVAQLSKAFRHVRSRDFLTAGESEPGVYKVLFLCFFSRQIESILPILRKMKNERYFNCLVLLSSGAMGKDILEKEGIPFIVFEDEWQRFSDIRSRIKNFKRWLQWQEFWKNVNSDFQLKFQDTNILPLIQDNVLSYINSSLFNLLDFAKNILQQIQPNLIVQVDDVNVLNRVFLFSGKSFKISTLHIQYGMMNKEAKDWLSNRSDKIAVFGHYFKDILVRAGIDEKRIIITGQPRYDDLVRNRINSIQDIKNIDERGVKKILFSSVPFFRNEDEFSYGFAALNYEEYITQLKALYSQISKMGNIELLVKLHPNPNDIEKIHIKILSHIHPKPKNISLMPISENIFNLLTDCDALITHHSTTGIEAMIFSKPVFIINLTGRPNPMDYTQNGAAVGIYKEGDICHSISNVLFSQEEIKRVLMAQKSFLEERYATLDGKATDNITKLIEEMLAGAV